MIELRDFEDADIPLLVTYLNNPRMTRYLSDKIPQPYTEEHAQWWVTEGSRLGHVRAILHEGVFVGCIGVTAEGFERSRTAELGYWLAEPFWGRGLVAQAVRAMVDFMLSETDIVRIHAVVYNPNKASMRVLEKSGFSQEAIQRQAIYKHGKFYNAHVFTLLKQGVVVSEA